jgi:hypothetical protein
LIARVPGDRVWEFEARFPALAGPWIRQRQRRRCGLPDQRLGNLAWQQGCRIEAQVGKGRVDEGLDELPGQQVDDIRLEEWSG